MLKLKNIKKNYYVASEVVEALKGVSISFRKQEFVSILGPSGCGKTTLLNIIGGLDQYTDGDLVINGRSTKVFKDRDWDVYRNHRIGFVFQSYNLIPHQTILENVELALTISGISKKERVERAKQALDKVGLTSQYNKKPNQLSGGQCQRVAIARAIVNDPEILLADEPTGALDTVTSVQIMEIIKEISKDRLVIMVTHNPDLAFKYSTRIVKLLDGNLLEDSNPYQDEDSEEIEVKEEPKQEAKVEEVKVEGKKKEKAKMSIWTAMRLSFRNLISKLRRTILVIIAGSIGIIGVSTVLAGSNGIKGYIVGIQDDLLSGNPIQIEQSSYDYNAIFNSASIFSKVESVTETGDWVNVNSIINYLVSNQNALEELVYTNTITKDYVNYIKSMPKEYYNEIALRYGLNITPMIYTDFETGFNNELDRSISLNAITETYTALLEKTEYAQYSSAITSIATVLNQTLSNKDYILSQYDLLYGELPDTKKNPEDAHKLVLVLNNNQEISDLVIAQLGLVTQKEFYNWVSKYVEDYHGEYDKDLDVTKLEYEAICSKEFRWYPNDVIYNCGEINIAGQKYPSVEYSYEEDPSWKETYKDEMITLKVGAIIRQKDNLSYTMLGNGFYYTEDFAREVISRNINSEIVQVIKDNGGTLTSTEFNNNPIGIHYDLSYMYTDDFVHHYYADGKVDEGHEETKRIYVGSSNTGMLAAFAQYMTGSSGTQSSQMSGMASMLMNSKSLNLNAVGGTYLPKSIRIYPNNFETKYLVTDYLDAWNKEGTTLYVKDYKEDLSDFGQEVELISKSVRDEVKYNDNVELVINMINLIIDIITYALVVFTSLALVVSTVMIGIITYVSVVERVKEIGVIRSLGGSKRDVSHLFNAETLFIGFSSGIFGIVATELLTLLINAIVNSVSGGQVSNITNLTLRDSIIMILISMILTTISGLLPARSAARKNPVDALRSE